jgi:hypothetical protein
MSKIPKIVSLIGIVLLVVSVIWWQQTFGFSFDYVKCLGISDGVCRMSGLGKVFGGAGYNPLVFWIGLGCLVGGNVLNRLKIF